jgi:hypothetical protein
MPLEITKPFKVSEPGTILPYYKNICQWKGINRKQSTRWQHLSRLKAIAFFSLQKNLSCYKTQQHILGTGIAIWWLTEPHRKLYIFNKIS